MVAIVSAWGETMYGLSHRISIPLWSLFYRQSSFAEGADIVSCRVHSIGLVRKRGQLLSAHDAPGTFDSNVVISGKFVVNTTTPGAQTDPTAAPLTDGRFVNAWTDQSGNRGRFGSIRAQIFNALLMSGQPTECHLKTCSTYSTAPALCWRAGTDIHPGRRKLKSWLGACAALEVSGGKKCPK